jgi:serine phosphatase RsbU (regulator of sigma subunit)
MSEETINDGMDISLCSIRKLSGTDYEIQWAGANNSLWYVKNNEFSEIKANKFPIGRAYVAGSFTNHTIQLSKNDYLVLYSDGFADQFGGDKGKKYKYKNLVAFIRQAEASGISFSDLSESLDQEFEKWKGKNAQIDDVCVLGIKL